MIGRLPRAKSTLNGKRQTPMASQRDSKIKAPRLFCAMPPAMMRDKRMGRSVNLFKVMMAVCSHDRMSQIRGGFGCYASREVLVRETRLDPAEVSRALRNLTDLGYLERKRDRKSLVYTVPALHYPPLEAQGNLNKANKVDRRPPQSDKCADGPKPEPNWGYSQLAIGSNPNELPLPIRFTPTPTRARMGANRI